MGTQLVLSFAKRYFFNLSNALNSKHNSQTIRILSPYRNISLFSFVFILKTLEAPTNYAMLLIKNYGPHEHYIDFQSWLFVPYNHYLNSNNRCSMCYFHSDLYVLYYLTNKLP